MSSPVTVVFGRASSTPTAARPDPAPASSTLPAPDVRNLSVGSSIGRLRPNTVLIRTSPITAQTTTSPARTRIHRGHRRHNATPASPAASANGTTSPYATYQL